MEYGMGFGIWDMGWDLGFGIWDGIWDMGGWDFNGWDGWDLGWDGILGYGIWAASIGTIILLRSILTEISRILSI
jgi:hypothetical protein